MDWEGFLEEETLHQGEEGKPSHQARPGCGTRQGGSGSDGAELLCVEVEVSGDQGWGSKSSLERQDMGRFLS